MWKPEPFPKATVCIAPAWRPAGLTHLLYKSPGTCIPEGIKVTYMEEEFLNVDDKQLQPR